MNKLNAINSTRTVSPLSLSSGEGCGEANARGEKLEVLIKQYLN
jgi:hypothetical protein